MSPSIALACNLNPLGRLSLIGPVFFAGPRVLRGDRLRLSDCLLIRTILKPLLDVKRQIIQMTEYSCKKFTTYFLDCLFIFSLAFIVVF